jgi:predicted enzyme involved in methoxymalonyl-ACP biosynthesis
MVGAAAVADGEILQLVFSCRALGMGVEHTFMRHILEEMKHTRIGLRGRIVATARNIPVRNFYRDNGFVETHAGLWEYGLQGRVSAAAN